MRTLDPERIIVTLQRLHARISERFPRSGLAAVCADLCEVAEDTAERTHRLARPRWELRLAAMLALALALAGGAYLVGHLDLGRLAARSDVLALAQGLDAAVDLSLLAFGAVWALMGLEARIRRRGALKDLYRLRALAHVVDMHQLTKDPSVVLHGGPDTSSSPKRKMTDFELARYLDYCAEMLALIAKLAALYAEGAGDPAVIEAVSDLETLSSDLGRKILQKIALLTTAARPA